jgi:hypothetical protein
MYFIHDYTNCISYHTLVSMLDSVNRNPNFYIVFNSNQILLTSL